MLSNIEMEILLRNILIYFFQRIFFYIKIYPHLLIIISLFQFKIKYPSVILNYKEHEANTKAREIIIFPSNKSSF